MFTCMEELMFYDQCVGPNVILGNFAAGLGVAMVKAVNLQEIPEREAESAQKMSKAMDASRTDCTLELCCQHAVKEIKKKPIKAGSYPLEIRKELTSLIWVWI